ncbi:nicotinate phosphoribosyltransferase [Polycladidibacter hongkongensis]|uniref:nicotinate phosphoribosyltransferase n=1 Tax=Polycladidibacter hongkongensis TaxID=1647556 RepID=UPI00082F7458|nr:nicotinate phosphoribosyltransferase [Pseudovibrio hongkongensis]
MNHSRVTFDNPLLDTDSYKYSHHRQYPPATEHVSAYVEARKPSAGINNILFFGLQMELAKLRGPVVTHALIDEAEPFITAHGLTANIASWRKIVDKHGGRLPVRIDALPEGTFTPIRTTMMRITNTDPEFPWLPTFLETRLLRSIWYPSTVATISYTCLQEIRRAMLETDGDTTGFEFKLHDFGARGASSFDTVGRGGAAHLIGSMGTDSMSGLVYARNYYDADMAGFSIPASEHSTMTSWGGEAGELTAMANMLDQYPTGLVACVSDSFDLFHAIEKYWGDALKDKVLQRDGVLVVRPDSGNPVEIVPQVIEALGAVFGFHETSKGYKLLHDKVRVIQGDGVSPSSIRAIMEEMKKRKLAIGNIAFGMGGALLQKVNRDTFGFAMKASAICRDGQWQDVFKAPATSLHQGKASRPGRQATIFTATGVLSSVRVEELDGREDLLQLAFENGELTKYQTFDQVRAQAASTFKA